MKIKTLKILTSNLANQIDFYTNTIGLKLISESAFEAKLQVGTTILILKQTTHFQPYHFAINIPANQAAAALTWLSSRVEILKDGTSEIQQFKKWNAEAIYFYDKDQNIVELIARKTLNIQSAEIFSPKSLLSISEIGAPVDDLPAIFESLQSIVSIPIYDGSLERFCAIGDENGLFIFINKTIKDWFPTGEKAYSAPFEIVLEERGEEYRLGFEGKAKFITPHTKFS